MLKNAFGRKFAFRSDSNATPTQEVPPSTCSNDNSSVSDAEIKEVAYEVNKDVEISESYPQRYVDKFGDILSSYWGDQC